MQYSSYEVIISFLFCWYVAGHSEDTDMLFRILYFCTSLWLNRITIHTRLPIQVCLVFVFDFFSVICCSLPLTVCTAQHSVWCGAKLGFTSDLYCKSLTSIWIVFCFSFLDVSYLKSMYLITSFLHYFQQVNIIVILYLALFCLCIMKCQIYLRFRACKFNQCVNIIDLRVF